uniref:ubiquitinyl hydrolase 1 n=1 Tax=Steinernema glaseri TaxID=37863 RepID=A0A1I8A752_9BILA
MWSRRIATSSTGGSCSRRRTKTKPGRPGMDTAGGVTIAWTRRCAAASSAPHSPVSQARTACFVAIHLTQGHLHCAECGDYIYDRKIEGFRRECENAFRRSRGFTFGKHQHLWNPSQGEIDVLHSDHMVEFYSGTRSPFAPYRLLYLVWKNEKHLAGYEQQDAHEFLISALSTMHHQARSSSLNTTTLDCKCIIDRIYTGQLQSAVCCRNCGAVSRKLDPFRDLSLNVDQTTNGSVSVTLAECLRRYTTPEPLDDGKGIRCEHCTQIATRTQQLTLYKLPLVMCFHLKRLVHHKAKKSNVEVSYPEFLDVTEFTSPYILRRQNGIQPSPLDDPNEKLNNLKNRYALFAVVNHFGTVEAGHYTCFVKHQMKKWYLCDDERIIETSPEVVLGSEGYLLFYHKQFLEYE